MTIATNPRHALAFMSGVTRWEVAEESDRGLGTRIRMLMRIGSAEIGGLIEIVEWSPPHDFAWHSVTGLDQRGRLRLRRGARGKTKVEFRLAYGVAGSGLSGWLAERLAAPSIRAHLERSLTRLGQLAEHEQRRQRSEATRPGARS